MAEWLTSLYKNYEPVQADEENAFEVVITPELQLDDVVEKVLEIIKTIWCKVDWNTFLFASEEVFSHIFFLFYTSPTKNAKK